MERAMRDGFLGYKSSLMLDVVVVALVAVVPVVLFSLYQVKVRKNFQLHKQLQVLLAVVLLLAVSAFEIDLQWVQGGWRNVVDKRDPKFTAEQLTFVRNLLWLHLVFAITTPFLWAITLVRAFRGFANPPTPGAHSGAHKLLGWASTVDLVLTSVTGLIFYYFAFIAR